jgi:Predicted membrane protein
LLVVVSLGLGFAGPAVAAEEERILDFKSHVQVLRDGRLTVTEEIKVVAAGDKIKRGIFRDFPTTYQDRYGNTIRVGFHVVSVLRDGIPDSYHVEGRANGKRVYIGRKDFFLHSGTYTYTITYKTDHQLGYFKDFDELYWNVTGNGWDFVIEGAEALIELPPGTEVLKTAAYTGYSGEKGHDFTTRFESDGMIRFNTTRFLQPNEGFTIAVAWPKGVVPEPKIKEKVDFILKENLSIIAALIGFILLVGYYFIVWFRAGQDPEKGTIIPRFFPPKGFSPEAVRFVFQMGYDDKAFVAAVINLAVNGALTIHEDAEGEFSLKRTGAPVATLARGERKIIEKLFGSAGMIKLINHNHKDIQQAIFALQSTLKMNFEKLYFLRNSGFLAPGIFITLLTLFVMAMTAREIALAAFMGVWLSGWTVACFFLGSRVISAWRAAMSIGGLKAWGKALGPTLFSLPFFAGEIFGLGVFSTAVSPLVTVLFVFLVSVNILFHYLLKAPTRTGRRVMDEIEGFKLYLSIAEKERFAMLHPPDKTPELFEKYLPYALALDVENQWNEQFAGVLTKATMDGSSYHPAWYHGRHLMSGGFASTLSSSFTSAISSSSTAPGSSSGSGGGGSSGGGGGGGGGGGW